MIYTSGQIGKRFHVPLRVIYDWRIKINRSFHAFGSRSGGAFPIPGDSYHRYGFPEWLVNYFPQIPLPPKQGIGVIGHQQLVNLQLRNADITTLKVCAIVNAANPTLLGGSGVKGAIHRAAGPKLSAACRKLHGCRTGQAKITIGFNLPAKYVIHTVGPIWDNSDDNHQSQELRDCYWHSLELTDQYHLTSIAFPAISTGAYHYPKHLAAQVAAAAVYEWVYTQPNTGIQTIIFVVHDDKNEKEYRWRLG